LLSKNCPDKWHSDTSLVDSLPIITSSVKRPNAVATKLTDKGLWSAKNIYYHGSKLHSLAFSRSGHLPLPESFIVTPASENDLYVQKQYRSNFYDRTFYRDKIYNDADSFKKMAESFNSKVLIPMKAFKGQSQTITQINKAADDLYSTTGSGIRQPIEVLFNWLIEKNQIASKVRSASGLIVHIFGRIIAA
jgi:hypothetical protein